MVARTKKDQLLLVFRWRRLLGKRQVHEDLPSPGAHKWH
jgi:hypothetical protein